MHCSFYYSVGKNKKHQQELIFYAAAESSETKDHGSAKPTNQTPILKDKSQETVSYT